jgi:hypothetical protein
MALGRLRTALMQSGVFTPFALELGFLGLLWAASRHW